MSIFKNITSDDRVSTKTLLHEAIPITGTIVSGTYGTFPNDGNVKNFTHGMFQSIYDYPYLSSSANHIFDLTFGTSNEGLATTIQTAKKDNIYNQLAQVLVGYDKNGNIQKFDEDGNITDGGLKIDNAIFLSLSRLLVKDEIKKGSFQLELATSASYSNNIFGERIKITDYNAQNSYKVNSPAGEYGILYASNSAGTPLDGAVNPTDAPCGLLYYQAGIAVLNSTIFMAGTGSGDGGILSSSVDFDGASTTLTGSIKDQQITASANFFRHRIYNMQFNNTIELNSTVYFCRVKHNEFNYSSNPTYLSGSQIRVKSQQDDPPISYITTVGLYSADNQLLAIGKFSEPIRKDNNIELTFRARLDY